MMKCFQLLFSLTILAFFPACDTVQQPPTEPKTCGTIQGLVCSDGEYCNLGSGQCKTADAAGVCEPIPSVCTEEFDPVCGCDGTTYSNACKAAAAGVSIDHQGACQQAKACGGITGQLCPENQFCDVGEGQCKVADAQGTCKEKPQACTREFNPVCGCDGKTYGNACQAAAAGISIDHQGACGQANVCGGLAGQLCPENQFCDRGEGQCKIADAQGTCKEKPQACTRELNPVCGCDGKTYSNPCTAAAAGVSVDSKGECKRQQSTVPEPMT